MILNLLVQQKFQNKMNKKKYLFVIIVLFALLFSGCDYIFCKYKNLPDLGNGYKFGIGDCRTLDIINHDNTEMIAPEIVFFAFDSTFILAAQRPWDSIPGVDTMTYGERHKAFKKSTFLQYWIINKKEENVYAGVDSIAERAIYSNVYGPYKWKEYIQKRKELGVSKELKLKKVE